MVISISATPSDRQLIAGIPEYVYLTANIPSIIFYTLDGTDPTLESLVYSDGIRMPTYSSNVILKVFATNGIDYSAILALTYTTYIKDKRHSHASVTFLGSDLTYTGLIGGTTSIIKAQYSNSNPINGVDLADKENLYKDGYDWEGNFGAVQADSIPGFHDTLLSETDAIGQKGPGIGELPDNDLIYLPPDPEESYTTSKVFNPRAMVIFADSRVPTDIPMIFRPCYYDVDVAKNRPSAFYETSQDDGNRMVSGSFIRQHYNPKTNTMTYYYRDSLTSRWVISTESMDGFESSDKETHIFNTYKPGKEQGAGYVFRWILFKGTFII